MEFSLLSSTVSLPRACRVTVAHGSVTPNPVPIQDLANHCRREAMSGLDFIDTNQIGRALFSAGHPFSLTGILQSYFVDASTPFVPGSLCASLELRNL